MRWKKMWHCGAGALLDPSFGKFFGHFSPAISFLQLALSGEPKKYRTNTNIHKTVS